MWSIETIRRINRDAKQCPALSLKHILANHCVFGEGHRGPHENNLGTPFTACVMKVEDLPPGYGKRCPDHPKYKIKRKPLSTCEMCWRLWIKENS